MKRLITSPTLIAFLAGVVAVFGFAPFGLFPLPVLSLAALFWLWSRAERPAQAAWLGFAFGMGLFCAGIGWIYVALHIYGYMHPILAGMATAAFAAVNATLPAAAGYVQAKIKPFVVYPQGAGRGGKGHSPQQHTHSLSNHEWLSAIYPSTSSGRTALKFATEIQTTSQMPSCAAITAAITAARSSGGTLVT